MTLTTKGPDDQPLFPIENGQYKMEREPIVEIGVVLEEDAKPAVTFDVPEKSAGATDTPIAGPDGAMLLPPGTWTVSMADGRPRLTDSKGRELDTGTTEGPLVIRQLAPRDGWQPGDGIRVKNVVAGRGFHWSKEIDQTLTGDLVFHAGRGGEHLVMVNRLPMEEYLTGVITGEMGGECPEEFMKAQAVAARSWLLGQPRSPHPDEPFHWCNDDCCQRYQGTGGWNERARRAIEDCRGQVLITASDKYCDARYSKSTGGISEDARSVWHEEIEGLEARVDAPEGDPVHGFFPITEDNVEEYITGDWVKNTQAFASTNVVPEDTITKYLGRVDEPGTYFRWTVERTQADLKKSMRNRAGLTDLAEVTNLRTGKRGRSGRLEELHVEYTAEDGSAKSTTIVREYFIRAALSESFLYSSCIIIEPHRDPAGKLERVTLRGAGWGHGAGLCQIGGLGRALKGQQVEEILMAYYTGCRLEGIYA